MAWTNPTTRNAGDLITAAIWNTDLVNNLSFLAPPDAGSQSSKVGTFLLWDSVAAGVSLPAASVTTPTLPGSFKHLLLVGSSRSAAAATEDTLNLRVNGGTTGYYWQGVKGSATTASAGSSAGSAIDRGTLAVTEGASASLSAAFGGWVCFIPDYTNASSYKHWIGMSMDVYGGSSGQTTLWTIGGMETFTSAAITSLTFLYNGSNNIAAGSRFSVYGVS